MNKEKMKKILWDLSSEEERRNFTALEVEKLGSKYDEFPKKMDALSKEFQKIDSIITSMGEMPKGFEGLQTGLQSMKNAYLKQIEILIENNKESHQAYVKAIGELKSVLEGQDFNKNAGPLYKDMINALAGVKKEIKDKPVPHWQWPQYASVSVRDKNFANITPASDPFHVGDFDDVVLTYSGSNVTTAVYKLNGITVATLTLTYSGSNVTEVKRT